MTHLLASIGVFSSPVARFLLLAHLMLCVFAIGVVTHHWRHLLSRDVSGARLAKFARWMAIAYPLALLAGVLIYPTYNVMIRKPPIGVLEAAAPWAVGLFEIKEHLGTIALVMLPWLVLSANRYGGLNRIERTSYHVGTWVFTIFVYFVFVTGALVAMLKCY